MLKRCIAVLCCLTLFIPSTIVFALDAKKGKNSSSKEYIEKEVSLDEQTELIGGNQQGQSGGGGGQNPGSGSTKPGGKSKSGGSGKSTKSSNNDNKGSGVWWGTLLDKKIEVVSRNKTQTEERSTKDETLYWEWQKKSGPGKMTIHESSSGSIKQVNGSTWQAGQTIIVSFDKAGDYIVSSAQVMQRVTTITPITIVTTKYRITEYYTRDGTSYSVIRHYFKTTKSTQKGTPQIEKEPPRKVNLVEYKIRVTNPNEAITLPTTPQNLKTTSKVIFSRRYVYTDDIIDEYTDKPFELEVIYDFTANTTIKSVSVPEHIITRYKNLGTMTIRPVEWKPVFYNGNKSVRIWARFRYPKAAMPGKSPMYFRVQVNTRDGVRTVGDQIDVPVNTFNLRFTNLPESERGEFYPIQGLTKVNNREFIKNFGTITYANIYVK